MNQFPSLGHTNFASRNNLLNLRCKLYVVLIIACRFETQKRRAGRRHDLQKFRIWNGLTFIYATAATMLHLKSSTNLLGKVTQQGKRKWVSTVDIGKFITFVCLGLCLSSALPPPPCSMLDSPPGEKIHFLSSTLKQGRGGKSN